MPQNDGIRNRGFSDSVRRVFEVQRRVTETGGRFAEEALEAQVDLGEAVAEALGSVESAQKEAVEAGGGTAREAVGELEGLVGSPDGGGESHEQGWDAVKESVEGARETHEDAVGDLSVALDEAVGSLVEEHKRAEEWAVEVVEGVEGGFYEI